MKFRLLAAALFGLSTATAHAVTIEVKNCSGDVAQVYSYNSTDIVNIAPYFASGVGHRNTISVACGTDRCKIKVTYGGSSNNAWDKYTYALGVCARSPYTAELEAIERCTC